jgi:hypothetical protein
MAMRGRWVYAEIIESEMREDRRVYSLEPHDTRGGL